MLSEVKTTEWLLKQWSRWAYSNRGLSINWSSMEPYERMAHERMGDTRSMPEISDDEALIIDRAVSELRSFRALEGEALARYYLNPTTYRELGKAMGKHHQVVAQLVDSGKMWVEGRIRSVESLS